MRFLFRGSALMVLAFTLVATSALASTDYTTMGYTFQSENGGSGLTFDSSTGAASGFSVESGDSTLGYVLTGDVDSLDFSAQISFSNYSATNGNFGLEMGWNTYGNTDAQLYNTNADVTILRGTYDGFGDVFATSSSMDLSDSGGSEVDTVLDYVENETTSGTLKLVKSGMTLSTYWAAGDGEFTLLKEVDLTTISASLGEFLTISFIGQTNEGGEVEVSFSDFDGPTPSATPIPGAAWLLGTGLAGLVGLRKKYRA